MKKPFGYTPYGPVTAVNLNFKFHRFVNVEQRLKPFHLIEVRALPTLNNLTRVEGAVPHATFSAFRETLHKLKIESKIEFLKEELNPNPRPHVVEHINLDRERYPDDDLPF